MQTNYNAVRAAFLHHVAPDIGPELDAAYLAQCPDRPEWLDLATVAAIVTAAALGEPVAVASPLVSIGLFHNARLVPMTPDDAAAHPLLRDWLPLTITGAVHQALLAGAMMMDLAPGCPEFGEIEAVARGGEIAVTGIAYLRFGEVLAALTYGDVPANAALVSMRRLRGDALQRLGADLPLTSTQPHAVAQAAALEAADAALVTDAFLAFQEAGGAEHVH